MTEPITALLAAGVIKIAKRPPANPRDIEGATSLTIPLIASDYEALTPAMWNAVYHAFSMPDRNVMVVADPANASDILSAFRQDKRYRGGGCGIGFKGVVLPHLNTIEPPADAMGAANIMKKIPDSRLAGWNTDGLGYALSLEERFERRGESLAGKRVLLIGGGRTARAIAIALAEAGMELNLVNRTESKAEFTASIINQHAGWAMAIAGGLHLIPTFISEVDVVIAAIDDEQHRLDAYSPLGAMEPSVPVEANLGEAEANLKLAKPSLIVSDIRLRERELPMLRQARALGLETLDGKPMVVNQGVEAFWWLYGQQLERTNRTKAEVAAIMRKAAR